MTVGVPTIMSVSGVHPERKSDREDHKAVYAAVHPIGIVWRSPSGNDGGRAHGHSVPVVHPGRKLHRRIFNMGSIDRMPRFSRSDFRP
eukprot:7110166-Lingulodinium_polyedra.AAC.1